MDLLTARGKRLMDRASRELRPGRRGSVGMDTLKLCQGYLHLAEECAEMSRMILEQELGKVPLSWTSERDLLRGMRAVTANLRALRLSFGMTMQLRRKPSPMDGRVF